MTHYAAGIDNYTTTSVIIALHAGANIIQSQSQRQNTFIFQRFSHEGMKQLKNYHLSSKPSWLWNDPGEKRVG